VSSHIRLYIPNCINLLVHATKLKAKYGFHMAATLFYILKKYLNKSLIFFWISLTTHNFTSLCKVALM